MVVRSPEHICAATQARAMAPRVAGYDDAGFSERDRRGDLVAPPLRNLRVNAGPFFPNTSLVIPPEDLVTPVGQVL